ncbi:hypothetical protein ACFS5J_03680 [Flavobacterium chuncheonense]|uniref:Uncharacterized protein n=1 Tax=Flavobacterium chuncheonense TaxID=2026653 RepID=A0ABW5YJ59_9FLAO
MKRVLFLFLICFSLSTVGQENYESIIVPSQFSFFKEANKFNLNALTKSFFEAEGYTVFYDTDNLPRGIASDRCQALLADVIESNTMFKTIVKVVIKDCTNKVIYESIESESREKDLQKAYTITLRDALSSMKGKVQFKKEQVSVTNPVKTASVVATETVVSVKNENQLFAIPTAVGYKLVDAQPVTVMVISKTSVSTIYIAEKGKTSGVLIQKGSEWFFEYYQEGKLISEKMDIKF